MEDNPGCLGSAAESEVRDVGHKGGSGVSCWVNPNGGFPKLGAPFWGSL